MIYQAVIFTILVFILKKLVFKKVVTILDKRKQHIENQLQLTEQYKLDAARNLETSGDVLKQARIDAREIMKQSENEAKLIINEAKEKAQHILNDENEQAFQARTQSHPKTDQIKGA